MTLAARLPNLSARAAQTLIAAERGIQFVESGAAQP